MDSKTYWTKKIIEWEDSMKPGRKVSFIERLASLFRGPLKGRSDLCMEMILPYVPEKTVLEIGCGSGYFALDLFERGHPTHITGLDISEEALKRAAELVAEKGLSNSFTFQEGEAPLLSLPEADIVLGLGFLDYLSLDEIESLFSKMQCTHFLFTFAERKFSIFRYMHILYLMSQNCTQHYYFTQREILERVCKSFENVQIYEDPRLSFGAIIHNLPPND